MSEESIVEISRKVPCEEQTPERAKQGCTVFLIAARPRFSVRDVRWIGDLGHGWPPRWDGEDSVVWERRSVKVSGEDTYSGLGLESRGSEEFDGEIRHHLLLEEWDSRNRANKARASRWLRVNDVKRPRDRGSLRRSGFDVEQRLH